MQQAICGEIPVVAPAATCTATKLTAPAESMDTTAALQIILRTICVPLVSACQSGPPGGPETTSNVACMPKIIARQGVTGVLCPLLGCRVEQ